MRVLVTGANDFVGAATVRRFGWLGRANAPAVQVGSLPG